MMQDLINETKKIILLSKINDLINASNLKNSSTKTFDDKAKKLSKEAIEFRDLLFDAFDHVQFDGTIETFIQSRLMKTTKNFKHKAELKVRLQEIVKML